MSVDIEALIVAAGMEPKRFVTTPVFTASVSFPAGRIRRLDLMVGYDPVKNSSSAPDNPYHGQVWARQLGKRFARKQQKGLAAAAQWYVELAGVAPG